MDNSSPIHIGGVGQGIALTFKGTLSFLHGSGSRAYYSSDAKVCLISLGLVQRTGGSYATLGLVKLIIRDSILLSFSQMVLVQFHQNYSPYFLWYYRLLLPR